MNWFRGLTAIDHVMHAHNQYHHLQMITANKKAEILAV